MEILEDVPKLQMSQKPTKLIWHVGQRYETARLMGAYCQLLENDEVRLFRKTCDKM